MSTIQVLLVCQSAEKSSLWVPRCACNGTQSILLVSNIMDLDAIRPLPRWLQESRTAGHSTWQVPRGRACSQTAGPGRHHSARLAWALLCQQILPEAVAAHPQPADAQDAASQLPSLMNSLHTLVLHWGSKHGL